jgi:hypothetical protein
MKDEGGPYFDLEARGLGALLHFLALATARHILIRWPEIPQLPHLVVTIVRLSTLES